MGEREKRLARNETLYREANERVAEVAAQLLEGETRIYRATQDALEQLEELVPK